MATRVGPTEKRITHDISLTNNAGSTILGLKLVNPKSIGESPLQQTSLKMSQGDTDYSDFNLPFTPITQKEWSGGRAQENFEDDKTRYSDSYQVDTTHGDIRLAPAATLTTGIDETDAAGSGSLYVDFDTASQASYVAGKYVSGLTGTYQSLDLYIANRSTSDVPVSVAIYADTGGPTACPGAAVSGAAGAAIVPAGMEMAKVRFPMNFTVSYTGVSYWIVIEYPDANLDFGVVTASANIKWLVDPEEPTTGTWSDIDASYNGLQFSYSFATIGQSQTMFFEYKGAAYAVVNANTGGAPRLFINGYRGTIQTSSVMSTTIKGVSADLTGKIIKIVAGKGYDQQTNWREVDYTGLAGEQIVKPYWDVAPDATTELVVLGCDLWEEIASHGLTKSVTDICVANGIVYFAQGEATTIRRMREYNNAGTWTREFAWDGTDATTGNKATFLEAITATTGKMQIWKANNPTDGTAPNVSYAPLIAWDATTDLDFTTKPTEITGNWPIPVGDSTSKITGVAAYGTPIMPWVMKEDSFGAVSNGIWAAVPVSELKSARSEDNGRAVTQYGVYLYFSLLDGLDKYYDNRLDDVGPNRDQGLSLYRRGAVVKLIPYPGRLIAMIDAGNYGNSSIMVSVNGWHEIHRGDLGRRIRDGIVQVMPGSTVDRLWYEEGGSIYWIPIAVNPDTVSGYAYSTSGYVISSWMNGGFREINKFWGALQIFAENLTANIKITAYYQTDVSSTWTALGTAFTTAPMQKVAMTTGNTAYGKRWRYKLLLQTNNTAISPKVKAVTVESITRVPMKATWALTAYADDAARDIQGTKESLSAKTLLEQIKTWANSDSTPLPLTMHSNLAMFDDKDVFVESPRIRPISININGTKKDAYILECTVIEV